MGYLAGLISREEDVSIRVLHMLNQSSKIRGDNYGVASPINVEIHEKKPDFPSVISNKVLGYKQNILSPLHHPQPVLQTSGAFLLEGELWNGEKPPLLEIGDILRRDPMKGIKKIITEKNGAYALAVVSGEGLICGRDHIGTTPIYYGSSQGLMGIASNRKMLWSVGLEPVSLPPGTMIWLTGSRIRIEQIKRIGQPPMKQLFMDVLVDRLDKIIHKSITDMTRGITFAYLGFSGGIDSGILAMYLKKLGIDVELISVGLEGQNELQIAEETADKMDLPISIHVFNEGDVKDTLDETLLTVEEPNPMKISVAIPTLWSAKMAAKTGGGICFSGNGSDELFGGYFKFVRRYLKDGKSVQEDIFNAVSNSWTINYDRDWKIFMDQGLEVRFPFAHPELINFGLSIPLDYKLPNRLRGLRKCILRKLAKNIGLPDEISLRPKKAIQYSTGVNKVLKKMAKEENLHLHEFLVNKFRMLKRDFLKKNQKLANPL
jgi:asparagine synthase (glutamine-hydrolysing)